MQSRAKRPTTRSLVVTEQAFKEAKKAVHAFDLRWHQLRDYFTESFVRFSIPYPVVDFMLGHVPKEYDHFSNLYSEAEFLRKEYVKIEKRFFV